MPSQPKHYRIPEVELIFQCSARSLVDPEGHDLIALSILPVITRETAVNRSC